MKMLRIEVVGSLKPREVLSRVLELAEGSSVATAMQAWAQAVGASDEAMQTLAPSIWGESVKPSRVLRCGDRLELSRCLRVDPKVARRERFAQQGARGTGLFAKRRPGAKPGY